MSFFRFYAFSGVLALALASASACKAEEHPSVHWDYSAEYGASKWVGITDGYKLCGEGAQQSPVNIAQYKQTDLPAIEFTYTDIPLSVSNSGHTVQVNAPEGQAIKVGDRILTLKQIHFHTPSEHYLDGVPFPMETHFVHTDADGNLATISVMMKVGGQDNPTIAQIWSHIPAAGETAAPEGVTISLLGLLPAGGDYYAYTGSLTAPPCTEGVSWHVMKQPIEISEGQLRAFQALYPSNARPIQPLNGRVVKGD